MIGDYQNHPGTEHQSTFPEGHVDWVPGLTCDECNRLRAQRRERHGPPPLVSGLAVMRDNQYASVYAMEKQAIADARRAGIEPERV